MLISAAQRKQQKQAKGSRAPPEDGLAVLVTVVREGLGSADLEVGRE